MGRPSRSNTENKNNTMKAQNPTKSATLLTTLLAGACIAGSFQILAGPAVRVADAIWANDRLYGTVATDTKFKSPPAHSTDAIYSFAGSGLEGQRSVSEAAPGDPDYNGGRWSVMAVTFTDLGLFMHDMDNDGMVDFELTNAEDVLAHAALGHLTIEDANVYFECPLRP